MMTSRLVVFRVSIILLFAGLTVRLWDLQMSQGQVLAEEATARRQQDVFERPLRGEIFAGDGTTRLAESQPSYTVAVRPSQLPRSNKEQQRLFARLDDMLSITGTLVLSPTEELRYVPGLWEGIESVIGPMPRDVLLTPILTATVPVSRSADAFLLTQRFTDTLRYESRTQVLVRTANLPAYQTVPVSTTQSLELALLIKENAVSLPGVVVERDFQRHYPRSAEVPSLSHLLGYIGPVDQCDIIRRNPRRYWEGLYTTSALTDCGLNDADVPANDGDLRYMLSDRIGKDGLERTYEEEMRGQLGKYQVDVDVHQREVSERRVLKPNDPGLNLVLTIDFELQRKTEEILKKWLAEAERRRVTSGPPAKPGQPDKRAYSPIEAGVAVVLEVNTGRVLSMVSWPSFDNNIFNRRRTEVEVEPLYHGRHPQAINKSIAGLFPPGSTWKQISAAAALEGGVIGPNTRIHDPGALFVKNKYFEADPKFDQRFPNSFGGDRGFIDVREALRYSSNVFFESVMGGTHDVRNLPDNEKIDGLDETAEKLAAMARAFGFGSPTGIPLPGEAYGTVPSKSWKAALDSPLGREPWSTGDTYNFSIGQGNLLVTPLQLAVASAAVANNGTLYEPQLVKSFTDATGKVVREVAPVISQRVPVSPEHLQVIREGMRLSVTDGFNACARADLSGVEIAGKTGTAEYPERIDPTKTEYDPENIRIRSHAWFAGFAPYDNPEIEVVVLVEGAGDLNDGSATLAVPAVTEIMQAYFGATPAPESFEPVPPYNMPCH
jgi:penicillin-binding protein 2